MSTKEQLNKPIDLGTKRPKSTHNVDNVRELLATTTIISLIVVAVDGSTSRQRTATQLILQPSKE